MDVGEVEMGALDVEEGRSGQQVRGGVLEVDVGAAENRGTLEEGALDVEVGRIDVFFLFLDMLYYVML
jgi:hypothetical protein